MNVDLLYVDLVDDDHDFSFTVQRYFQLNGVKDIRVFYSPTEYLNSKEDKKIAVIDQRFEGPEMTGVELAEQLIEKYSTIKIIIITGLNFDAIKMYNLRPFNLLNKDSPTFFKDLIKFVKRAIEVTLEEIELEKFTIKKNIFGNERTGPSDTGHNG